MKKRIFVIKVLRYTSIILLLLTILVLAIKKWHLSQWLKCRPKTLGRHSSQQNRMFPNLLYEVSFTKYIIYYILVFFKF